MMSGIFVLIFKEVRDINIPEKVKLLFKTYDVKRKDELHDEGNELYGQIQYLTQIIHLRSGVPEEQAKATLIHEILHGLDDIYRIGLKEKQVEILGTALYQLIIDNPEMFNDGGGEKCESKST